MCQVVITRPKEQALALGALLEKKGVPWISLPAIEIRPLTLSKGATQNLRALAKARYSWLLFTSVNGVTSFKRALRQARGTWKKEYAKVACVGPSTAQSFEHLFGHAADLVPEKSNARALASALKSASSKPGRTLLVTARGGRPDIPEAHKKMKQPLDILRLYQSVSALTPTKVNSLVRTVAQPLILVFYSPSAFNALRKSTKCSSKLLERAHIVSIGPTTSKFIRKAGCKVSAQAKEQSDRAVVAAIVEVINNLGK